MNLQDTIIYDGHKETTIVAQELGSTKAAFILYRLHLFILYIYFILSNVIYSCNGKAEFSAPLLLCHMIPQNNLICRFGD